VFRPGIACCTSHRIDDAREFHKQAVAGGLHDAAVVLADFRIEELAAQRFEAFERPLLVRPHQARIARDIGGEDRREPAFDASDGYAVLPTASVK
jgi:hypothetical protein